MEQERLAAANPAAAPEWLPPGAALAHFEPPEGAQLVSGGEERVEVHARYGFRIGELGLLINSDTGSEVLALPAVSTLPGSPPGFLGLVNLRGNLVPLYDLRILLGMGSREASAGAMVLVFGQGEQAVAVLIDGYPKALLSLLPLSNLPPLPDTLSSHVPGGYVQDDAVWLEFDHVSFFDEVCGAGLVATES